MTKINLNGCTTAELLIRLKEAYEQLYNEVGFTKVFVYNGDYVNNNTEYSISSLFLAEGFGNFKLVIFANGYTAVSKNASESSFYTTNEFNYKSDKAGPTGATGATGNGIASIVQGDASVQGNMTVTPITINYTNGTHKDIEIVAQNGATGATGASGKDGATGAQGIGIALIENDGFSYGDTFTISHIKITLTNGVSENIDVQALNNAAYQELIISSPSTAETGTLTEDELAGLQANPNKVIVFNNETYRFADDMTTEGYLVYSHIGMDNLQQAFLKFITITISTRGWVLTTKEIGTGSGGKYYRHLIELSKPDAEIVVHLMAITKDNTPYTSGSSLRQPVRDGILNVIGVASTDSSMRVWACVIDFKQYIIGYFSGHTLNDVTPSYLVLNTLTFVSDLVTEV